LKGEKQMSLIKEKKAEIMEEFGRGKNDTGSVEVQVAILTERINELTEHFKLHIHDNHSKVGLMKMVGKRRSLLDYLKQEDVERYQALIKKLNLRK
jgi:small subunit ribosomal protein S15